MSHLFSALECTRRDEPSSKSVLIVGNSFDLANLNQFQKLETCALS